jgi:C4-dicarboxylate transporter DctM subunit
MNTVPPDAHQVNEPPSVSDGAGADSSAWRWLHRFENAITIAVLSAIVLLPLAEISARQLTGEGIPDSISWVRHLTLWLGFLGAALASRADRHLSIALVSLLEGRWRRLISFATAALTGLVCVFLTWASVSMVRADRESADTLGGIVPIWIVELIMPAAFAVLALRVVGRASARWPWRAALAGIIVVLALVLLSVPPDSRSYLLIPGLAIIVIAGAAGAPIFALLGGAALFLFYVENTPIASIPVEAYRIASNPILPSLPLFTLAGAILAEGQASARLVRVFRAWFGFVPGGAAIAAVLVCAFFTTFTGGSGVTILALGGLMFPVLLKQGHQERFSLGLLTAAGSLGILFPPSLVIILYGVQAQTPIDRLFLAGIVPGLLLVALVAGYAAWMGRGVGPEARFELREAAASLWAAKWEVAVPVVVLASIFSGYATLVEAASLTVLYTVVVETVVHRELSLSRHFPRVLVESTVMIGGIFIILACAMGLTNYMIDADIPTRGADWVQSGIQSRAVFLLALNGCLLIVGCLMDIFSAIVVVVPLILPVADAFGVDRLQLGVIFLANMELGYLTPPVGMNLFVAGFRFKRPLLEIYRASIPFLLILLAGVLLITYVPWLTLGILGFFGMDGA